MLEGHSTSSFWVGLLLKRSVCSLRVLQLDMFRVNRGKMCGRRASSKIEDAALKRAATKPLLLRKYYFVRFLFGGGAVAAATVCDGWAGSAGSPRNRPIIPPASCSRRWQ